MANSFSTALWENIFYLYMAIAIAVGALILGWLLLTLVRFRARPGSPRPADAPMSGFVTPERGTVVTSWVLALIIAAIMFGLAFSTIHAVDAIENPPPDEPSEHFVVTGFQFGWKYNYTGEGGIPFQTVTEWTVPVDTVVTLNITSQDVWHNFAMPNYHIRVDAIPGETNHLWFKANDVGDERNVCVQICGTGHAKMISVMHVVPRAQYDAFVHAQSLQGYQKLAAKNALNATFDGTTLAITGATHGNATALNITNTANTAATFQVQGHAATVTVAPGQSAYLYLPAGAKTVVGPHGVTGSVS